MQSSCHEQHIKWAPQLQWTLGIFSDCVWGAIVQLRLPAETRLCTCWEFDPDLRKPWERIIWPWLWFCVLFFRFPVENLSVVLKYPHPCIWKFCQIASGCCSDCCRIIRFLGPLSWYQPDISPPLCVLLAQTCTHFPSSPSFYTSALFVLRSPGSSFLMFPWPFCRVSQAGSPVSWWAVPRMGSWPACVPLIGCFPLHELSIQSTAGRQTTRTTLQQLDLVLWCAEVPRCWYCSAL